jgi:homoserine dehydrogenase
MRKLSIALLGFGNVGQAFIRLLLDKQDFLHKEMKLEIIVTGIYTAHHGTSINTAGINIGRALEMIELGQPLNSISEINQPFSAEEFIQFCSAEFILESTPLNPFNGQPALSYLETALSLGKHVVTANKGPLVFGYERLRKLAQDHNKGFYYESAVMDGAPIFSLFREALPGIEISGFKGILNSCTNFLLDLMSQGTSFEKAIAKAKSIGIAETDPSADIDGWDAAIKVAALSTVIMGYPITPQQVERTGIREISLEMIQEAGQAGEKWKLICEAKSSGKRLIYAKVKPERIGSDSPLFNINGTSSYVQFETDVLPGLGITESDPGPKTTAYGMFADVMNINKNFYRDNP